MNKFWCYGTLVRRDHTFWFVPHDTSLIPMAIPKEIVPNHGIDDGSLWLARFDDFGTIFEIEASFRA